MNDSGHLVCLEYELADPIELKLQFTGKVSPMEFCIGVLGLKIENQTKMNDWVRDMRDWGMNNCDFESARKEINFYKPGEVPK